MDKDVKTLICEIILMIIMLMIIIPICVNASNSYSNKKENMQKYNNIAVNISNNKSNMIVTINNYNKKKMVVNLILKTSKFSNNYMVQLDDKKYDLSDVVYTEDDNNYYFNLGSYEVDNSVDVEFQLNLVGNEIYDDSITYSFLTEVANC